MLYCLTSRAIPQNTFGASAGLHVALAGKALSRFSSSAGRFARSPEAFAVAGRMGSLIMWAEGWKCTDVAFAHTQVQLAKDVIDRSRRQTPIHRVPQPSLASLSF